jgi:hypothetical protein
MKKMKREKTSTLTVPKNSVVLDKDGYLMHGEQLLIRVLQTGIEEKCNMICGVSRKTKIIESEQMKLEEFVSSNSLKTENTLRLG